MARLITSIQFALGDDWTIHKNSFKSDSFAANLLDSAREKPDNPVTLIARNSMKRCRLIYRSKAKDSTLDPKELEAISKTSQENNKKQGIVGILILSGNQFLQVLEGPTRYVNQLYNKIAQDPRHEDIELIHYEQINTPYFYEWSMRLIELDKLSGAAKHGLLRKYPNQDENLIIPDNLIILYSLLHDARDMF